MIKELYMERLNQIALNVTNSRIDSIRKKNIIKSGCRVYEDGYIGVSGTMGHATDETWDLAIKNLENKVPYKVEPTTNKRRRRDLRQCDISSEGFLQKSEELLDIIRNEYPNFILSNKIKLVETETLLRNNRGLEYIDFDRHYSLELVVREKESLNIVDTIIMKIVRVFDIEEILREIRVYLSAFDNKVELPKNDKIPIIMNFENFGAKIKEGLNGRSIYNGISIFSDKIGMKVFSKDFTVYVDRSEENFEVPFFDAEGSTLNEDRFMLIDGGIINFGYTDKETSKEFEIPNTATSNCCYDEVPNLYLIGGSDRKLSVKSSDKTLIELLGDKEAIWSIIMNGTNCTNKGDFSSLVQMSYLIKEGKIVGRLPSFSVKGNIYKMFADDYIGQSSDKVYFGENAMVINMFIN